MSFHSSNKEFWTEGVAEGSITRKEIGKGGFGYDPVFRLKQTEKTFAEMTTQEKNKIRKDIYRINCYQLTNKLKVGYKKHILIFLGHCADLVQCSTPEP